MKHAPAMLTSRERCAFGASLAALACALLIASSAAEAGPLTASGRYFRDASGRAIILRGVNVAGSSKLPPFLSITDPAQLDRVAELGFNSIRLVFSWEAYEPYPGQFNETYLSYLADIARAAGERGIYTVVDVHQDVYSRYVSGGCGAGFPGWTIAPTATPDTPNHGPSCSDWLLSGLNDPDMHQSFNDFYANTTGARGAFLRMLQRIAARFVSEPGVIGYDILNEPWGSETAQIAPLYADAVQAIRSSDPTAIAFVEPQLFQGKSSQSSLPKPAFGNYAYAPHFYDLTMLAGNWNGDTAAMDSAFVLMNAKAAGWNAPLYIGEFGGAGGSPTAGSYIDAIYGRLDAYLASSAQWNFTPLWNVITRDGFNGESYSIVNGQGALRPNYAVRPFPRAIAGQPLGFGVTPDRSSFALTWGHVAALGSTEIFVPVAALYGAQPPIVETTGESLTCAFDDLGTTLECSSPVNGLKKVIVRPQS